MSYADDDQTLQPSSLSLGELVRVLGVEIGKQHSQGIRDEKRITEVMKAYDASRNEWKRFALCDSSKSYTRNLIATDNKYFTLMLLCWNPNSKSPIHDHSNSECWLRVISGTARESLYSIGDDKALKSEQENIHDAGAICYIDDSIGLHSIANEKDDINMISLHCYSPPFDSCKVFLDEDGHGVDCSVTFYSEHGQITGHHTSSDNSLSTYNAPHNTELTNA